MGSECKPESSMRLYTLVHESGSGLQLEWVKPGTDDVWSSVEEIVNQHYHHHSPPELGSGGEYSLFEVVPAAQAVHPACDCFIIMGQDQRVTPYFVHRGPVDEELCVTDSMMQFLQNVKERADVHRRSKKEDGHHATDIPAGYRFPHSVPSPDGSTSDGSSSSSSSDTSEASTSRSGAKERRTTEIPAGHQFPHAAPKRELTVPQLPPSSRRRTEPDGSSSEGSSDTSEASTSPSPSRSGGSRSPPLRRPH